MKTLCFKTRNLWNIFALSGCIFHMGFYDRPEVLFVDFCRRCEYIALLSKPRPLRCSIKTVSIVRDVVFFVYISIIEKVSFLRQLWLLWINSCFFVRLQKCHWFQASFDVESPWVKFIDDSLWKEVFLEFCKDGCFSEALIVWQRYLKEMREWMREEVDTLQQIVSLIQQVVSGNALIS